MAKQKRTKAMEKLNLSEHTLDINIRKCNYEKFRFADVEDYVRAVSGGREYQFQAIKCTMIYLWGGGYKNVIDLVKENFSRKKHLKERFGSEEIMIAHLPLPDRISGVVHMATGTGKSYVIFAIAYLSLVMGLTKRVLVLGPSSTIIEEGLRDKFTMFLSNKEWNDKLPKEYQGKEIDLLTNNDVIEDGSITIENINAIYSVGGIRDTIFNGTEEILVLGDEIHHAYSHLNFNDIKRVLEFDRVDIEKGRESEEKTERLWMQFLKKHSEITRHIGFTGTPYNKDDYFADVIFDYNIRTAINEYKIKDINPIINVETDEGEMEWTTEKRFTVVLKKHLENAVIYSYKREDGKRRVKPITVFYCPTQINAQTRSEEFIRFLRKWMKEEDKVLGSESEIEQIAREKVICVISNVSESEYKGELNNIEETDPSKIGGKTEFIFSVGKLLEGWDVDNIFQIVPMEERVFNSKLLISQVIGRGLRIPRKVFASEVQQTYPCLTVTNHEKFADYIRELMDAVMNSDMYILSEPLPLLIVDDGGRGKHHFSLFNLEYSPAIKFENATRLEQLQLPLRELILTKYNVDQNIFIERIKGTEKYALKKRIVSVDSLVDDLYCRFKVREYEGIHFDFGNGEYKRCPEENEIRETILTAMEKAGIIENCLTVENKKQIDLFFNQFLPRGKKKRIFENITGDINPTSTLKLECKSIRVGELDRDATAFISESHQQEVDEKTKAVLKYLVENRKPKEHLIGQQQTFSFVDPTGLLDKHKEYVRPLIENDDRPPYIVNPSVFKTPQSTILVSHYPEKEFVFRLLEYSRYIESWIKSPDKGFYSIDYEYWKGGKNRVRRGFNPDFFIKINLDDYISILTRNNIIQHLDELRNLHESGVETIIRVVEIKSDDDDDEATPAKGEWAKAHFMAVNQKLQEPLPSNSDIQYFKEIKQFYTFNILMPDEYDRWFKCLKEGKI